MIFYNNEQRRYAAITLGLIVVLLTITFWNRGSFQYKDTTDYAALDQRAAQQEAEYRKILDAAKPDPVASQQLFKQLISEDEVRSQIEIALDVDQPIVIPVVDDSKLTIGIRSDKDAVTAYLRAVGTDVTGFNNQISGSTKTVFDKNQDPGVIGNGVATANQLVTHLYQMPVPREAVAFHKAMIVNFQELRDLLSLSQAYHLKNTLNPWPEVYRHYAVINETAKTGDNAFRVLNTRYQLSAIPLSPVVLKPWWQFTFVHEAHAQLGGTIIVGNVPQAVLEALEEAFATAFAKFATQFLDEMLGKIDSNYKIANFLYYSDALQGQYVNDYLNKYVNNATDRGLISKFIPEFNCGQQNEDLRPVFQAKAREYLGFEPATVRPDDPHYLDKLFKVGTMLNDPNIWEITLRDAAAQAGAKAEAAANKELLSPGYKASRTVSNEIATTLGAIDNAQQALFNAQLNLGVVNVENIVGQITSGVLNSLFNKFLFNGAVVLNEQRACIATPQFNPLLPASDPS